MATDWKYLNESVDSVDLELILSQGRNFANMSRVALFAQERQNLYVRKQECNATDPPWTNDKVLQEYKFTNCYRVLDRTSQYLIREVINPFRSRSTIETTDERLNLIAQIYLFKLFNSVDTWERLKRYNMEYCKDPVKYLPQIRNWVVVEMDMGRPVYSTAYALCTSVANYDNRIDMYMAVLNDLLNNLDVRAAYGPGRILTGNTISDNFELLRKYHGFGDFLAYQFALDFSYAARSMQDYSFVVPGPGCIRGMTKVFGDISKVAMIAILRGITHWQDELFEQTGCEFAYLQYVPHRREDGISVMEHRLQVNDWQNIFCEFDKYSRLVYPDMRAKGTSLKAPRNKYNSGTPNPVTVPTLPWGWS